jgi:hypothetical protein
MNDSAFLHQVAFKTEVIEKSGGTFPPHPPGPAKPAPDLIRGTRSGDFDTHAQAREAPNARRLGRLPGTLRRAPPQRHIDLQALPGGTRCENRR